MSNILEAKFQEDQTFVTTTRLWQYDYGQILKIEGLVLPSTFEVHFANAKDSATVTQIGQGRQVVIPDSLLQTGNQIFAYIYLHNTVNDGETVYKITIPVVSRPEPSNEQPTPVQQDAITQAIAALNQAVEQTGEDLEAAEAAANRAEEAASSIDQEMVSSMVEQYLEEHPVTVDEQDPTVPEWAKCPTKPSYTADEVGALSAETLPDAIDTALAEAKASGEFDGVSPSVSISTIAGGHRVTITDENGDHTFDVMDGNDVPETFVAIYGTTSAQAIYEAFTAGKICVVKDVDHEDTCPLVTAVSYELPYQQETYTLYAANFAGPNNVGNLLAYTVATRVPPATGDDWLRTIKQMAPISSPAFTGSPTAPTPIAGDDSTNIATTEFVQDALPVASSSTPQMDGTGAAGSSTTLARGDHVHPSDINKADVIIDSASGAVASFSDGLASPVVDLEVEINPAQDLHGYGHPWAGGSGKNLCNGTFLQGYWAYADGAFVSSNAWITTEKIPCKASTYYTASASTKATRWQGYVWYDSNGSFISTTNNQADKNIGYTAVSPSNAAYLVFNIAGYPGSSAQIAPNDVSNFQIEEGQTATEYAPYANVCAISGFTGVDIYCEAEYDAEAEPILEISWQSEAGTVYGGTLDVTTGLLTVTWANIASYDGETLPGEWISNVDAYSIGGTPTTGAQVTYALAEPLIYQLTPHEVSTLLGANAIWHNANGDTNVNYKADTTGVLAKKAPIDSPAFTGTPTAPTPTPGDDSEKVATTAFVADADLDKADVIVNTASGTIASFDDGMAAPIKGMTVKIDTVQDLNGYDGAWPAGGGVNLFPYTEAKTGTAAHTTMTSDGKGTYTINGDAAWSSSVTFTFPEPFTIPDGTDYKFCLLNSQDIPYKAIEFYNGTTFIDSWTGTPANRESNYSAMSNKTCTAIKLCCVEGVTYDNAKFQFMFVPNTTTVTGYIPYENVCPITGWTGAEIYHEAEYDAEADPALSVTFPNPPGTVYGGKLTVNEDGTGKLTIDREVVNAADFLSQWDVYTVSGARVFALNHEISRSAGTRDIWCNMFKAVVSEYFNPSPDVTITNVFTRWANINVRYDAIADLNAWKTFIQNHDVQIGWYIPPVEYDLTAEEVGVIQTLYGANTVWADTGDVTLTYRVDTKLALDKNIGLVTGRNLIGMDYGALYPIDVKRDDELTMSTGDESNLGSLVKFDFYGADLTERIDFFSFTLSQKSRTITWVKSTPAKYVRMYTDEKGPTARIQLEYGNEATPYSCYKETSDFFSHVPKDYYLAEMAATIASVKAAMTEPCLVFPLITDMHMTSYTSMSQQLLVKDTFRNIKWLVDHVPCDCIINLGDNTDGGVAKNLTIGENAIITRNFQKMGLPYYLSLGNHDTNYYSTEQMSMAEIYATYFSDCKDVIFNPDSHGTEYYRDFDVGIRLVVINANYGAGGRYSFSSDTAAWLTATALDTDNVVVLCSHLSSISTQNWSNNNPTNSSDVTDAIQAFVTSGGKLVQLCGHSHCDYAFTSPWTTVFTNCNKCEQADPTDAGHQAITGYVGTIDAPARTVGTATEDCWTVAVVRPTSRKINLIRFGAGSDREYSF